MALRALIRRPPSFYLEHHGDFETHDERNGVGVGASAVYSSSEVMTFHNLVSHDGGANKQAPELMMQALVAMFLFR